MLICKKKKKKKAANARLEYQGSIELSNAVDSLLTENHI